MTATRVCTSCNEVFPATTEFFYKQKGGVLGLKAACKRCTMTYVVQHRAKRRVLANDFTDKQWNDALKHFTGCAVCGARHRPLAVAYWLPLEDPNCTGMTVGNILPLCHGPGSCNATKGSRNPKEWLVSKYGAEKGQEIYETIEKYFQTVSSTK